MFRLTMMTVQRVGYTAGCESRSRLQIDACKKQELVSGVDWK